MSHNPKLSQDIRPHRRVFRCVLLAAAFFLTCTSIADAYIGPGAGFAVASSLFVIFWTIILAVINLVFWPFRWIVRAIRGRHAFARSEIQRLVILGLDGMEHTLAEKYMADGKMPNLKRLAELGGYKLLGTTTPPLSPVAWSSFLTGVNPGKHNIYDFLNTDRRNYTPFLSSVDIQSPTKTLKLGKYVIPLNKPAIRLLRKGKPFWNTLGEHGIFTSIIRVPITWPPEKCRGVVLSAMCVPDLRGTQGLFSFYSTRSDSAEHTGGEQIRVKRVGDTIRTEIIGPENSLKPSAGAMKIPITVEIKSKDLAVLKIDGESFDLRPYVYTPWVTLKFKAGPGATVSGICRFMLVSIEPEFELYAMPINLDPEKPAMPISHPQAYSTYLAKRYGPYATLGLAEDTWVLNEGLVDDGAFLDQCISIDAEREQQFFDALENTKRGLCVCVFDGTDRIQHMFWRYLDDTHPAHPKRLDPNYTPNGYETAIEDLYLRMDELVGETMKRTLKDDKTMLMVISDHGFNAFRRGIDLNVWLIENGYMALKPGAKLGFRYLSEVDWSKTRAFALGLAGLFINVKGRESKGIVEPGAEAQKLKDEIIAKLTGLKDPQDNQPAIRRVFDKDKCYQGPFRDTAPDLVIGYHRGYRVDWDTAIGKVTDAVFHDNTKAWSGDHCIDPELIPGVFFCSHRIRSESPRLMDLGPTALKLFGVNIPGNMDGRPLDIDTGRQPPKGAVAPAVATA